MEKHLKSFRGDANTWNTEFEKRWREHPEEPAEEAEHLINQADSITEAILSIQPRTLAGLAVLARAAAVSNPTLWYEDDEDRLENRALKRLIEATWDLARVPAAK
jgi:hypothetical protein